MFHWLITLHDTFLRDGQTLQFSLFTCHFPNASLVNYLIGWRINIERCAEWERHTYLTIEEDTCIYIYIYIYAYLFSFLLFGALAGPFLPVSAGSPRLRLGLNVMPDWQPFLISNFLICPKHNTCWLQYVSSLNTNKMQSINNFQKVIISFVILSNTTFFPTLLFIHVKLHVIIFYFQSVLHFQLLVLNATPSFKSWVAVAVNPYSTCALHSS